MDNLRIEIRRIKAHRELARAGHYQVIVELLNQHILHDLQRKKELHDDLKLALLSWEKSLLEDQDLHYIVSTLFVDEFYHLKGFGRHRNFPEACRALRVRSSKAAFSAISVALANSRSLYSSVSKVR